MLRVDIKNSLPMVFFNDSGITVSFQVETALYPVLPKAFSRFFSHADPCPLVYAAVSLSETLQKQGRADRVVHRVGEA
jgi:hypothetical protein